MKKYVINHNLCSSCGICFGVCSIAAIDTNDKGEYVIDPAVCIKCDSCTDSCPDGAIEEVETFNTVGDFNTQFKNCSGFKKYTKKNSDKFVINEELSEMFLSSGAGNVNLTGYHNKKFTTSFPTWVDKFTCNIQFTILNVNGLPQKLKCVENTHTQHTTKSDTIYGCLNCTDKNNKSWLMQFAFEEDISVGTEIDLSQYVNYISGVFNDYNTSPAITSGNTNVDFKILNSGKYILFKTIDPFKSMHEKNPVL